MAARSYRELKVWNLAHDLRREVIAVTASEPARGDRKFCDSWRDTVSSVCRNVAEGFTRFDHPEFAQFLKIALSSLAEAQDHLDEALARGFVNAETFERLHEKSEHVKAAAINLYRYLNPDSDGYARRRRRVR